MDKPDINGEHGMIIKFMEHLHKDSVNRSRLLEDSMKEVKSALQDFISNAPCKEHSTEFKLLHQQTAGRTRWRMLVVSILVTVLVSVGSGLVAWGGLLKSNEMFGAVG